MLGPALGVLESVSSATLPFVVGLFLKSPHVSRVHADFESLMQRMRARLYPETMPVLGLYWLKTVYGRRYQREEWAALDNLLARTADHDRTLDPITRATMRDVRSWILEAGVLNGNTPPPRPVRSVPETPRASADPNVLRPHIVRLLNEWLPMEVAQLLVQEGEEALDSGIPALALARALERLLVREHLSTATLEALLDPGLFSPRFVYPADAEILRDIVLFLLDRTEAPPAPVLPAILLYVAPSAPLSSDLREGIGQAFLATGADGDELHVPVSPDDAIHAVAGHPVRIAALAATMDGRWWQSYKIKCGEQNTIAFRPMDRLAIDWSADHARLRVPWPETQSLWPGPVSLTTALEAFGRRWHFAKWEQDAQRTIIEFVFAGTLPYDETSSCADTRFRRCPTAAADMAWATLEAALESACAKRNIEPIEQLRHEELIPLGRALFTLVETVAHRRQRTPEAVEARLRAVVFQGGELMSPYGRVPWRILPESIREYLRMHIDEHFADTLQQAFDGVPAIHPKPPARTQSRLPWFRSRRTANSGGPHSSRAA